MSWRRSRSRYPGRPSYHRSSVGCRVPGNQGGSRCPEPTATRTASEQVPQPADLSQRGSRQALLPTVVELPVVAADELAGRAGGKRPQHLAAKGLVRVGGVAGGCSRPRSSPRRSRPGWGRRAYASKDGAIRREVGVDEVPVDPLLPVRVVGRDRLSNPSSIENGVVTVSRIPRIMRRYSGRRRSRCQVLS